MPLGSWCEWTSMSRGIGVCTFTPCFALLASRPYSRSLALGSDLGWLDNVARRIAEGVSLVRDHGGEFGVRQLLPCRHDRVLLAAVHDDVDVAGERSRRNRAVSDGRERTRYALPVRLVTSRAVAGVDLLALGLQLIDGIELCSGGG